MAGRRSFKTDESFLEKLAIGAIGARAVFAELEREGHKPIELERGSMGYKLWKNIKIKRLRVPDILCLNCGTRVEARAKTQLEISMSHSLSDPDRGLGQEAAYIIGTQDQQACIGQIEELRRRDPEVYFAVTVLWQILASWVYDLEEY